MSQYKVKLRLYVISVGSISNSYAKQLNRCTYFNILIGKLKWSNRESDKYRIDNKILFNITLLIYFNFEPYVFNQKCMKVYRDKIFK